MQGLRSTRVNLVAQGVRIGAIAACCLAALAGLTGEPDRRSSGPALRLALLHAVAGDPDEARPPSHVGKAARLALVFPRGVDVAARIAKGSSPPTFGQPTIAGVGGWGFEADLRLDPTQLEPPLHELARLGRLRHELDLALARRREDVQVGAGCRTAEREGDAVPRRRRHASSRSTAPAACTSTTSRSPTSASRARMTRDEPSSPCNSTAVPDGGVDRQWYAIDGDPTAGGSLYLTNDEVGSGDVQCGSTQVNNVLVMYRSPVTGAAGSTAGCEFGPPNRITQPGSCDEGIMGNDEVEPGRDDDRADRQRRSARRSRRRSGTST